MNQEIKTQWIAALRSGQYKQGKGMLKQTTAQGDIRHCCLGVLCELYMQANPDQAAWQEGQLPLTDPRTPGSKPWYFMADWEEQRSLLPWKVSHWAGLGEHNIFVGGVHNRSITALNDTQLNFLEIAKVIEEHPNL
jgi:hypothetical protein